MKCLFLSPLFFFCAWALPTPWIIPRLPIQVILNGHYQMIPSNKIIGGQEVAPNSLPFQISLQRGSVGIYAHSCGGSILDEWTILDAAHCVDGAVIRSLRVVAGEHSLSEDSGLEQYRDVESFSMHPRYNPGTFEDDISLIFLKEPLDLSVPSAKPVNLPPPTSEFDPPAGTVITVSGWGTTKYGAVFVSDTLLSVDIPVVSDYVCNIAYGGTNDSTVVFPSMMCAGNITEGDVDACQGDSGGPLFTGTGEAAVQHGIVSWGQGCGQAAFPGVYTQVSYFIDWIAVSRSKKQLQQQISKSLLRDY